MARTREALIQELRDWIEQRKQTLAWYYHLGELVEPLHAVDKRYGGNWIKGLVTEVDSSADLLYKSRRFAKGFSREDIKLLTTQGVSWVQVILALGVEDQDRRMKLLKDAADKNWSQVELRSRLRTEFGSRRPGVGRSPKTPMDFGVEVSMRELLRLAAKWKDLCSGPWRDELKEVRRKEGAALKALLADTVKSLKEAEKLSRALLTVLEEDRKKEDSAS